jgi:polyhydroxyalkanoate synthesis regulator phasin
MIKRRNILIAVTAAAVVLSAGAFAFAATDEGAAQPVKDRPARMESLTDEQREAVQQARADSLEEAVTELVENGAITQEEADKLLEASSAREDNAGDNGGKQALTDEQREAVMQEAAALWKEAAAALVEEGTLTQEEADSISLVPQFKHAGQESFGILTEEQKTELSEAMKAKLESKLADLVDDGTITQEQADQLLRARGGLFEGSGGGTGFGHPGSGGHPDFNGKPGSGEQSGEEQGETL